MEIWYRVNPSLDMLQCVEVEKTELNKIWVREGGAVREYNIRVHTKLNRTFTYFRNEDEAVQFLIEAYSDRIKRDQVLIGYLSQDISDTIDMVAFWKSRLKSIGGNFRSEYLELFDSVRSKR